MVTWRRLPNLHSECRSESCYKTKVCQPHVVHWWIHKMCRNYWIVKSATKLGLLDQALLVLHPDPFVVLWPSLVALACFEVFLLLFPCTSKSLKEENCFQLLEQISLDVLNQRWSEVASLWGAFGEWLLHAGVWNSNSLASFQNELRHTSHSRVPWGIRPVTFCGTLPEITLPFGFLLPVLP